MQTAPQKRRGVKMWQKREGDRWVLKRGIIHSRERVEKTNHTRCEIENVKVKPPHQKRKEKCTNKISCPVEEEKKEKSFCWMDTKGPGSPRKKEWQKIPLDYIYKRSDFMKHLFHFQLVVHLSYFLLTNKSGILYRNTKYFILRHIWFKVCTSLHKF